MQAVQITPDVYWAGVQDPHLKVFDIIMTTEQGTTYNAYLVKGSQKTALIETVKEKFFDEYINNLAGIIDLSQIDYLVMNHTEPDHAGAVEKLLKKIPGLTVLGSSTALRFLKEIANSKMKSREVQHLEELDLGGKTLQFISAPFLHWPDSMYTYLKEDKILFSCDSFGSHYADPGVFNDKIDRDIIPAYKYYFDMIIGPFKPYVLEALDKIKDLPLEVIAPGHGPIIRTDIPYYIDLYRSWAQPPAPAEDPRPKIVLCCVTAYGYTRLIADSIVEGLQMAADFNIKQFDLTEVSRDEVLAEIDGADGLLIGSPTLVGDTLPPVWDLITHLSPVTHHHLVGGAFGSFGWSGEAVVNIEARLRSLRMDVLPGLRINFKPSERNLEDAFQFGMDFAKMVLEKKQPKSKKKWRCLICGHIVEGEEPPGVCPACGVSRSNFVALKMEDEFISDSDEKFLILGGGIAGLSAAGALRKRNRSAAITILTDEAVRPYYRPALAELLTGEMDDSRFFIYEQKWFEDNQVEVRTSAAVTALNTAERTVTLADGDVLVYDKLIIASGASSNLPSIPGTGLPGVFTLRNLANARALKAALTSSRRVAIIGGDLLGLEVASGISAAGLAITIVEPSPRLLPDYLDEDAAQRLADLVKGKGIDLFLGAEVDYLQGDTVVTGVKLKDGQDISADVVIMCQGVSPRLDVAQAAGIDCGRGVIVDNAMRTSASNVYAAGDAAQCGQELNGGWAVALETGRVAGANAAGDWIEYVPPVLSTLLKAFDMEIFSVGEVNWPEDRCRVVEVRDQAENFYKKSFIKDGVVVGIIIMAPQVDSSEALRTLGRDESGQRRSNRWRCRVCGYVHEGPEPPDECPACGASRDMFDPV
jgi:flavorubredoxin/NADPH-dependent 2,4-dienoyl-CoA reductase/sulfur reductase-like enzyme/rubredoxin